MRKIRKSLIVFVLIVAVIISPMLGVVQPSKIAAAGEKDADAFFKAETEAYTAYFALKNCLTYKDEIKKEYFFSGYFTKGSPVGIFNNGIEGVGFLVEPDDGNMRCDDPEDFSTLAKWVGYDSGQDLLKALFLNKDKGCTERDNGNKCLSPHKDKNAWMTVIRNNIRDKKLGGPEDDKAVDTLSSGALYWYYDSLFRLKAGGDNSGCGGILTKKGESKWNAATGKTRLESDNKKSLFANIGADGALKMYDAVTWSTDVKGKIQGVYDVDTHKTTGLKFDCQKIAKGITKSRAEAYQKYITDKLIEENADVAKKCESESGNDAVTCLKENGVETEPPETETAPGDDNVDSCEVGSGIFAKALGFVVCAVVDITFSIVDWAENNIIIPYLIVSPLEQGSDSPAYTMWTYMRDISNVMLVLALLYLAYLKAMS
jgi:hypothetical protein